MSSDELALREISARVPYGVKCHVDNFDEKVITPIGVKRKSIVQMMGRKPYYHYISTVKPYLRRLISISDEEKEQLVECQEILIYSNIPMHDAMAQLLELVYSRHMDYFYLIERGLALEAPDGMYEL